MRFLVFANFITYYKPRAYKHSLRIRFGNVLLLSAFLFIFDKGEDFVEYFVALRPSGVAVYKNKTRVGSYLW